MGADPLHRLRGAPLYIVEDPLPPGLGLSLEDELLQNGPSTAVMVWRHRPVIVAGRSTPLMIEVNTNEARSLGIPVIRRRTGGGAVYHDEGNLNITLVWSTARREYPELVYRTGTTFIKQILALLGVYSWVENEGDTIVDGYKISGSAAYIARNRVLFHATLLIESQDWAITRLTLPRRDLIESGRVTPAKYRPRSLYRMRPHITLQAAIRALLEAARYLQLAPSPLPHKLLAGALTRWERYLEGAHT